MKAFFTATWNWFNGNKTTIGLVLGYLLGQTWFSHLIGPEALDALNWVAATFLGVGITHKLIKANTEPGPNQ